MGENHFPINLQHLETGRVPRGTDTSRSGSAQGCSLTLCKQAWWYHWTVPKQSPGSKNDLDLKVLLTRATSFIFSRFLNSTWECPWEPYLKFRRYSLYQMLWNSSSQLLHSAIDLINLLQQGGTAEETTLPLCAGILFGLMDKLSVIASNSLFSD